MSENTKPWTTKAAPIHLQRDPKLVRDWWKVVFYVIAANIGTVVITVWLTNWIMSLGGDAGIPLWFWAFFLAFTTITQITTWGIAVYTYYTAMVLKFTAMKAGNTMTDIDKELMRWRKRLKRMGVTVDRFTPIFDEAEKEFKSLTDKERQEFFDDMREQVRKKIHELKNNRDGAEVPVPEGRVIECQQSDAVTESDAGKRKPETRTPE